MVFPYWIDLSNKIENPSYIWQLLQDFPAIRLQKVSESTIENYEALDNRLNLWINIDFAPLLQETQEIQNKIA